MPLFSGLSFSFDCTVGVVKDTQMASAHELPDSLQVHLSSAVVPDHRLASHRPRGAFKAPHLWPRLQNPGRDPELAFPTSPPGMQMPPTGDHIRKTTAQERRVKGPARIRRPTATINASQRISFHRYLLPSPASRLSSRTYRKASYCIMENNSMRNSKIEQPIPLHLLFLENAQG